MCFIYFASTFLFNATIDAAVAVAEQQAYSLSITTKFYMLRHLVVNKCSNAYIHCVIFFFFFILWISISMQYTSWLLCHFDTYLNGLTKKKIGCSALSWCIHNGLVHLSAIFRILIALDLYYYWFFQRKCFSNQNWMDAWRKYWNESQFSA